VSESEAQTKVNRPDLRGRRLVIVSNRLPFNLAIEDGHVVFHPSAGGLVTGLASFQESREHETALPSERLWVGWPAAVSMTPCAIRLRAKRWLNSSRILSS